MTDAICTRCGQAGHRASHCKWPASVVQACVGGWCTRRDDCPHYLSDLRQEPAERLCLPGRDGEREGYATVVRKPVGTWERGSAGLLAPASPFPEVV